MAKTVWGNLFFSPQPCATRRKVFCTPPRSSGGDGVVRARQAAGAVRKQQFGVAVDLPEFAQHTQGRIGQGHQAVAVALGVADVYASPSAIDITHAQGQPFAQRESPQGVVLGMMPRSTPHPSARAA